MHWADQLAEKIIARADKEGIVPNVKCEQTPSGAKHIGNLNDVARAFFPCKSVKEKGHEITFVHLTDDGGATWRQESLPDILVKGADYAGGRIVGREFAGRTVRIALLKGRSTTGLIRKMRKGLRLKA